MPYSSYDHDKLEAAETMRIERRIYFEAKDREIAPYASLILCFFDFRYLSCRCGYTPYALIAHTV